jgi:hypothetical protein
MAIEHGWDEQVKHVYYYKFLPGWTWDDFFNATQVMHDRGRELGTVIRFDVIGDFTHAPRLPKNFAISSIARIARTAPANRQLVVVATTNGFIRAMVSTGSKMHKVIAEYFVVARTPDEARIIIEKARTGHLKSP